MNTKAIAAAARVIHAAMKRSSIPVTLAIALDAAGLLATPEAAAERLALRDRVGDLPHVVAERLAAVDAATLHLLNGCDTCRTSTRLEDMCPIGQRLALAAVTDDGGVHEGPEEHTYRLGRDLPATRDEEASL